MFPETIELKAKLNTVIDLYERLNVSNSEETKSMYIKDIKNEYISALLLISELRIWIDNLRLNNHNLNGKEINTVIESLDNDISLLEYLTNNFIYYFFRLK